MAPETRYAKTPDGVHIAYQVVGEGPIDLVFVSGWVSNVDLNWTQPAYARFLRRLASFSRLIIFDKRGVGLSDRVPDKELPDLETRMDDVLAVMEAAGSRRAILFGESDGAPLCGLFAATYVVTGVLGNVLSSLLVAHDARMLSAGASGAIMGVMAAFAYLFPNTPLYLMFIPVPIKAKWAIAIYIAYDLFFGVTGGDNIAHFAHLGGLVMGFILVLIWNKTNKKTFY